MLILIAHLICLYKSKGKNMEEKGMLYLCLSLRISIQIINLADVAKGLTEIIGLPFAVHISWVMLLFLVIFVEISKNLSSSAPNL